jgi:hypothetical protein
MGGSGGLFGQAKQKSSGGLSMTQDAKIGEMEALKRQRAIAAGTTPSIAQMAINQNIDQTNQQAMSLAASQRGTSNPALAFRQAQIGNQQNNLQASQQGAMMAEQERRAADDFIARQAAAQRGVQMQSALANQQADANKAASDKQMLGGLGSAAMLMSDENEKENIKPQASSADEISKFLSALKPSSYEYKDEKNGTGEKIGVMAQDLEKTKVGKTMVDEAPGGEKMIDTNKAIGALLAGMADLNKKFKKLEK